MKHAIEAARIAGLTIDQLRAEISRENNAPTHGRLTTGRIHRLHQALENKLQEADLATKRDIISTAKACEVTFVKADGSRRVMRVQAGAVRHHVKGDKATRSGRIASHTRAFRHPNLLPVWDTEAQAIRSVNLATVERIVTRTEIHTF